MQILHSTELIIKSILETCILKAYVENKTNLHIYADKIEKLSNYNNKLDYNLVIYMMHCLSKQQLFLEKIGYSFYTFCLKDIVVIDDNFFFCINPELIMPINKNIITFYKPPLKSEFSSSELVAITNIPFKLSYKTIYYSFGALAIYCLGESSSYKNTKLYWFIRRCIGKLENKELKNKEIENKEIENKEIEERQLLFI